MVKDEELFAAIQSNGPRQDEAIAQLRNILLRGLSQSLNNRYGQPFQAEDIVQDALIRILSSLDQFQGRSKFSTWAMTIATRIGIASLRRKYHQDVSLEAFRNDDGYSIQIAIDGDVSSSSADTSDDILQTLQQLIDTELSDKQRMAIRAFLSDFSTDGIAEQMGSNRNAVYKLIHDARIKLKEGLMRAGVSAEDIYSAHT